MLQIVGPFFFAVFWFAFAPFIMYNNFSYG